VSGSIFAVNLPYETRWTTGVFRNSLIWLASPRVVAGKSEIKGLDWRTGSPPLFETIGVFSGLATRGQPPPGHKKDRGPIRMGTAAHIENLTLPLPASMTRHRPGGTAGRSWVWPATSSTSSSRPA
jgi:hypothetical protein